MGGHAVDDVLQDLGALDLPLLSLLLGAESEYVVEQPDKAFDEVAVRLQFLDSVQEGSVSLFAQDLEEENDSVEDVAE